MRLLVGYSNTVCRKTKINLHDFFFFALSSSLHEIVDSELQVSSLENGAFARLNSCGNRDSTFRELDISILSNVEVPFQLCKACRFGLNRNVERTAIAEATVVASTIQTFSSEKSIDEKAGK